MPMNATFICFEEKNIYLIPNKKNCGIEIKGANLTE